MVVVMMLARVMVTSDACNENRSTVCGSTERDVSSSVATSFEGTE